MISEALQFKSVVHLMARRHHEMHWLIWQASTPAEAQAIAASDSHYKPSSLVGRCQCEACVIVNAGVTTDGSKQR